MVGQSSSQRKAAGGPVDRSSLPMKQQLPQIIQLLSSKPLVSKQDSLPHVQAPRTGDLCCTLSCAVLDRTKGLSKLAAVA